MNKRIYLSTEAFPYGKGEKTFILPELEELKKYYEITIISHASSDDLMDKKNTTVLDDTIKVINIEIVLSLFKRITYAFAYFLSQDGWKEVKEILKGRKNIAMQLYQSIGFYALAMENYRLMKKKGLFQTEQPILYYTYWYFYYTYSLTKHRKKFTDVTVLSRTHGFDLYDERYIGGRQPFKSIMDANLDRLVFACDFAKKYYIRKMGKENDTKYIVSKIGTKEPIVSGQKKESTKFVIVSCSNIIPIKRVNIIVAGLGLIENGSIEWHHFGDGKEYDKIVKYAEKELGNNNLIDVHFHGFTRNEQILKFYSENRVDCFITTSSTEGGAPVSIQEAMSYGIPIIGTAVGGITEMIQGNGILLSSEPKPEDVKYAIEYMINLDREAVSDMRKNSLEIWKREYSAKMNVKRMIKYISKI